MFLGPLVFSSTEEAWITTEVTWQATKPKKKRDYQHVAVATNELEPTRRTFEHLNSSVFAVAGSAGHVLVTSIGHHLVFEALQVYVGTLARFDHRTVGVT